MNNKPKLIMLITEDWYFWTHRLPIALAAKNEGFDVAIATRTQEHGDRIKARGLRLIPIRLRRRSRNPLNELLAVYDLMRIYRKERPDIVHHVTIKPVLYGSWAAKLAGVPSIVNAIAGLGYVFVAEGFVASVLRGLISLAYRSALWSDHNKVIFQNQEDKDDFVRNKLVHEAQTILIRGSGVDLKHFPYTPESPGVPIVMYAGRILWDKGIGAIVDAAKLLNGRALKFRVVLVGSPDPDNPKSIPESQIHRWVEEGILEWWGHRQDMPQVLAQSSMIVLPSSYREGLPKILLEAGAIGRPVVTTDVRGCRDVIKNGENGFLVPLGDISELADAIGKLLENEELRTEMGVMGRKIVEENYSIDRIVDETLSVYKTMLGNSAENNKVVRLDGNGRRLR